ncbi:hypothetical protein EPN81_01055 [Patescibacteria group bacterium]|nr:MAG: hypothetical protein EPN81_01055 [Patescibacteria group bacterium]
MNHLKELLFEATSTRPALFTSQAELARVLSELPGWDPGKHRSMVAFLSQIFGGHRSLPDRWREALVQVAELRAQERGLSTVDKQIVLTSLGDSDPSGLSPLINEQRAASDVLILNPQPIELTTSRDHHAEARVLETLVFDGLQRGCRYHYCLASSRDAQELWNAITRGLQQTDSDATATIKKWVNAGLINISVVPELLILQPTVAFNTMSPDRLCAFVWHAPYDWENCLQLPEKQTGAWLQAVRKVLATDARTVPCEC